RRSTPFPYPPLFRSLSDLHVGSATPAARIVGAVAAMNELKPDLVVLTGDFVTVKSDPRSLVGELLGKLEVQSFAVLGNHDHWTQDRKSTRLNSSHVK